MEEKKSPLREIVEQAGAELGYEVIALRFTREGSHRVLKVFIDRPEGITIKDCEVFSGHLSAVLDEQDPISGAYLLEVSSPGIDRPLTKPEHFQRFAGEPVELRLYSPWQGRKKIKGILAGWSAQEDGAVLVEAGGEKLAVPWRMVAKARLAPDI
ncbi:MAG TPA: ribosome maturation factor RimP [Firmicutes bacterium]|jgi:ribosome maturation factor RimP|nr:ribosome maturation factor RimP [Bacillota bacterium]